MTCTQVRLLLINNAIRSFESNLLSKILVPLGARQVGIDTDLVKLLQHNKYDLIIVGSGAFEQAPQLLESIRAIQPDVCMAVEVRDQLHALQLGREQLAVHAMLAWMKIINDLWHHAIVNHALSISRNIYTLRMILRRSASNQDIDALLAAIERASELIRDWPVTPLLTYDASAAPLKINDFLRGWLCQVQEDYAYHLVEFSFSLNVDEYTAIRMSHQLIRVVFDILIDNAIKAMHRSNTKRILVTTRQADQLVEIAVTDTGCGVPELIREQLGHDVIWKTEGEEGLGMGIFLVQRILHAHNGGFMLGPTGPTGTTIFIRLPIEMSNEKKLDNVA